MITCKHEIKETIKNINDLNVDECVKSALLDEINKAKFFVNKSERLAIKHIGVAKTLVLGIKRHQRMLEDKQW